MFNNEIATPVYPFSPEINIRLINDDTVQKDFYDFMWNVTAQQASNVRFFDVFTVKDLLGADLCAFLSEDGIAAAERCLEHFALMELLPLIAIWGDDNQVRFTVLE